jgi:hypothetical protein
MPRLISFSDTPQTMCPCRWLLGAAPVHTALMGGMSGWRWCGAGMYREGAGVGGGHTSKTSARISWRGGDGMGGRRYALYIWSVTVSTKLSATRRPWGRASPRPPYLIFGQNSDHVNELVRAGGVGLVRGRVRRVDGWSIVANDVTALWVVALLSAYIVRMLVPARVTRGVTYTSPSSAAGARCAPAPAPARARSSHSSAWALTRSWIMSWEGQPIHRWSLYCSKMHRPSCGRPNCHQACLLTVAVRTYHRPTVRRYAEDS